LHPGTIIQLITIILLILLSAFFSSAETALTTVNKFTLRSMADSGNKRAARVLKLISNSDKLISTILIGNNIVNISASALATTLTTNLFGSKAVGIATGITLLILLFGEITPKTLAQNNSVKMSILYVDVVQFLVYIFTPFVFIINKISHVIFWILHMDTNESAKSITEDELITMVNVSEEEGVIENKEKEMITNVVDFGDSRVRDIMIPRTDVTMVPVTATYDELLKQYMEVPYTRLPVYKDSRDNVIGILHVKDLFFYKATHDINNFDVTNIVREPFYVYEFQKTNDLLANMKSSSNSIGIVLDEYGVCVGLISMEDLIEEIIGDIKDEYDDAEHNNIVKIDDTHYSIDGGIKLDDLNDALDLDIESEDYDSIGGYIIQLLDHLPSVGDTASDGVISCKVTKLDKNRVSRVLLEILPKPNTDIDSNNE
jgi:putative hemolysin